MGRINFRKGVIPAGTRMWKKVRVYVSGCYTHHVAIVEMITLDDGIIPNEYRRTKKGFMYGRKCRVPKAYVVSCTPMYIEPSPEHTFKSDYYDCTGNYLTYTPGAVVVPDSFNTNSKEVCRNGIHCFTTRREAEQYSL